MHEYDIDLPSEDGCKGFLTLTVFMGEQDIFWYDYAEDSMAIRVRAWVIRNQEGIMGKVIIIVESSSQSTSTLESRAQSMNMFPIHQNDGATIIYVVPDDEEWPELG